MDTRTTSRRRMLARVRYGLLGIVILGALLQPHVTPKASAQPFGYGTFLRATAACHAKPQLRAQPQEGSDVFDRALTDSDACPDVSGSALSEQHTSYEHIGGVHKLTSKGAQVRTAATATRSKRDGRVKSLASEAEAGFSMGFPGAGSFTFSATIAKTGGSNCVNAMLSSATFELVGALEGTSGPTRAHLDVLDTGPRTLTGRGRFANGLTISAKILAKSATPCDDTRTGIVEHTASWDFTVNVVADRCSAFAEAGVALTGTQLDDVLCGTDGPDIISGVGGNDRIYGFGGDDDLRGGDGSDTINGGEGNDAIGVFDPGTDAPSDVDTFYGGPGDDGLFDRGSDGRGKSVFFGEEGHDTIVASGGVGNAIHGGAGGDKIVAGGTGNTVFLGSDALTNELILSGNGEDVVEGSAGQDVIVNEAPNDSVGDQIRANGGEDRIQLGAGNDTVEGGAGSDTISGAAGNDTINGGADGDHVDGGAGDDSLMAGTGKDTLHGSDGRDILRARDGGPDPADVLDGGSPSGLLRETDICSSDGLVERVLGATPDTKSDCLG